MSDNPMSMIFQKQDGTVLFNPTDEDFDLQYAGISFKIKPGEKLTVPTNCANHVLNSHGQKGLSRLIFGADEKKVADDGRKRNYDFKVRAVAKFNEVNENRKSQGLGAHIPSAQIRKYASQLGVVLTEPYAARDEEKVKIRTQDETIASLQATLAALQAQISAMVRPVDETPGDGLRVKKDGKWVKAGE